MSCVPSYVFTYTQLFHIKQSYYIVNLWWLCRCAAYRFEIKHMADNMELIDNAISTQLHIYCKVGQKKKRRYMHAMQDGYHVAAKAGDVKSLPARVALNH